jgi:hypothetical protein
MIFGSPSDFAIEAEDDGLPADPKGIVSGHMQIWCSDSSIGDFAEGQSSLRDSQRELAKLAADLSAITDPAFWTLSDEVLWDRFDRALYIDHGQTNDEIAKDQLEWGRYDFLTNWGETFDGYKGMIYCLSDGGIRMLVQQPDDLIRKYTATAKGFMDAIAGFSLWCTSVAERSRLRQ